MTHKHVYSFKCVHRLSSYGLMIYASAFIIIFIILTPGGIDPRIKN